MLGKVKSILSRWRFGVAFIAKIFVFAMIYWLVFFIRPDAFNFASGYNANPITSFIEEFYTSDETEGLLGRDPQGVIADFQLKGAELHSARNVYFAALDAEREKEEAFFAAGDASAKAIEANIRLYEAEKVEPLQEEIAALKAEADSLPYGFSEKPVILTKVIALNEQLLSELNYLIGNRIDFADETLSLAREDAYEAYQSARETAEEAGSAYRELRGAVHNEFYTTRQAMLDQVGFADFLYFSACFSTTTTFGDITANQAWLRTVVVAQILAGILILSAFIDSFRNSG